MSKVEFSPSVRLEREPQELTVRASDKLNFSTDYALCGQLAALFKPGGRAALFFARPPYVPPLGANGRLLTVSSKSFPSTAEG